MATGNDSTGQLNAARHCRDGGDFGNDRDFQLHARSPTSPRFRAFRSDRRKCRYRPTAVRQPSAVRARAPRSVRSPVAEEAPCPSDADDCKNLSETLSSLPRTCVRTAVSLPVISSGPKPGIAFGSLKSHWFSAMPIKSRMAGSLVHAFRNAARVNSLGTRLCRNPRTSVLALIASIDGRLGQIKGFVGCRIDPEPCGGRFRRTKTGSFGFIAESIRAASIVALDI